MQAPPPRCGDFRDRLCRKFAAEAEQRSKGTLKFRIYPGSSPMKTTARFSAMRKGALDLSLPRSEAGGEVPDYQVWRPKDLSPILASTTKESTMLLLIIGMSLLCSYVMGYLHISRSAAQWAVILLMVIVFGFFLPPVSIILMTAPILLPPLKATGFDLVWFGIVMTVVMAKGLIHPPLGRDISVIKTIAPDIPLMDVIRGVMPFVGLMFVALILLCLFPGIATGLPKYLMGVK